MNDTAKQKRYYTVTHLDDAGNKVERIVRAETAE